MAITAALGAAVIATDTVKFANADPEPKIGIAVPPEQFPVVVAAARSCTTLSPARLAGQLMANSAMNPEARHQSGREGIAGLENTVWTQWQPWPKAQRGDESANITALAHHVCDLIGQLRVAKVPGDPWRNALAAFQVGKDAVQKAGGVPDSAAKYVDEVAAYTAWYAQRAEFGGAVKSTADMSAKPVPDEYVAPIVAAGKSCAQVSAPLVAAHLMAASGFNPNKLGGDGARGIAQFSDKMWETYGPKEASAWDAKAAIPALGTALCGLSKDLTGVTNDAVKLSVAAFEMGPDAARQVAGRKDQGSGNRSEQVWALVGYYSQDNRLTAGNAATAPASPSPSPSPSGRPATSKSPAASPKASPTGPPTVLIKNRASNKCLTSQGDSNVTLIMPCTGAAEQRWEVRTDGTLRAKGFCLDVPKDPQDGTSIRTAKCSTAAEQKFKFDQELIVGIASGKCVDGWHGADQKDGDDVYAWVCVGDLAHHKWYFG
ncbi:hypothetical protein Val02_45310 [Virgisporangium aliadipatigenens]|uniref:Ricin B lectin domain-containing protein n=1 Tax=Virgisporangium aliadipatigenens TaxID=741659 RepID=A0A8J3YPI3_9ACTN|nr:ricin-type beta-trefoil lectin domain protein [Virgisporangium aliadipatigenens]GIJ47645.1 hypothetical protein Val02_45310 [Virgisporangium aliadipatigenens]